MPWAVVLASVSEDGVDSFATTHWRIATAERLGQWAMKEVEKLLPEGGDGNVKQAKGGGVYAGESGVAITLLRVASALADPEESALSKAAGGNSRKSTMQRACLEAAEKVLERDQAFKKPKRLATMLEGEAGRLAALACVQHALARPREVVEATLVQLLVDLPRQFEADMKPGECEVLYGRAGFLHALARVRHLMGPGENLGGKTFWEVASRVAEEVLQEGSREAANLGKCGGVMLWRWHGRTYLGAIHGVAGILHALLQLADVVKGLRGGQQWIRRIYASVAWLLEARFPDSGNLPSSLDETGRMRDKLVHFCHGATGLVPLLRIARAAFPQDAPKYDAAAKKAADVIRERGFLTKGPGLCHGVAGSGYALLAAGGPSSWDDAARMALYVLDACGGPCAYAQRTDHPASLYEGYLGAVCLYADLAACVSADGGGFTQRFKREGPAAIPFPAFDTAAESSVDANA